MYIAPAALCVCLFSWRVTYFRAMITNRNARQEMSVLRIDRGISGAPPSGCARNPSKPCCAAISDTPRPLEGLRTLLHWWMAGTPWGNFIHCKSCPSLGHGCHIHPLCAMGAMPITLAMAIRGAVCWMFSVWAVGLLRDCSSSCLSHQTLFESSSCFSIAALSNYLANLISFQISC